MFEIVVGSDFQFSTISGNYTCTFYCRNDEISFPDDEWTDFEVISLSISCCSHFVHSIQKGPSSNQSRKLASFCVDII